MISPRSAQLDSLRAIAVALVAMHHWTDWGPAIGIGLGNIGVQLFFMLSGFLITRILLGMRDRHFAGEATMGRLLASSQLSRIARTCRSLFSPWLWCSPPVTGGPCFALIELLQTGRSVVTSPVGGIPDNYEGRPQIGDLVPPDDPALIAGAFDRIARGAIDPTAIRAVYEAEFREPIAHRQWLLALGHRRRSRRA